MKITNGITKYFNKLGAAQKSAVAFMLAGLIQQGISFIVTPLFTRILSVGEFGVVTVYNSWNELVGTIAMLSLSSGIYNVGMIDYENSRDKFTSALLGLSNCATVITMLIFYALSLVLPKIINMPQSLFVLMLSYFLFYPATRFWMARQRFEYKYKMLSVITIISALLSPAVGLFAVYNGTGNLGEVRLWGTNSVLIFVGLVFYINIVRKNHNIFDADIWRYALKFSLPLIPHYMAMHILSTSDRIMIQTMIGTSEAGLYGLAYTASMIICFIWTAIQGSLTPYVYECLKKREYEKISDVAVPCIVLFSLICYIIVLIAPEFITILGGNKYAESVKLMPPLIAAVLFIEMYNLFSMIEFFYKKTIKIMFATLLAAVINILLNYICIKRFGYIAAAYTTLICYIAYCIFHYINMRTIEPVKLYNGKFLCLFSITYIAVCLLSLLIYPFAYLRYTMLFVILVLLYVKRDYIFKLIKSRDGVN